MLPSIISAIVNTVMLATLIVFVANIEFVLKCRFWVLYIFELLKLNQYKCTCWLYKEHCLKHEMTKCHSS